MSATLVALVTAFCIARQADPDRLVRQLADDSLEAREEAEEKLIRLGEKAREALHRAAAAGDAEVKARAAALLKRLDVYVELRPWYAPPSRVGLSGEMSLEDAVREIERQTGQKVAADSWPEGKVRVDLRDIPYWQSLESICQASGKRSVATDAKGVRLVGERWVGTPSITAGPFRIALSSASERREFSVNSSHEEKTLTLGIVVAWETSIAPVRCELDLTKMEDDAGRDVLKGFQEYQKRISAGYYPAFLEEKRGYAEGFAPTTADPPGPNVKHLSRIEGTITVYIRGAPDDIKLDIPAAGAATRADLVVYNKRLEAPTTVQIALSDAARKGTSFSCKLSIANVDVRLVNDVFNHLYVVDGTGKKYQGIPGRISLPENAREFSLQFDKVPGAAALAGMTIRLPRKLVRKDIAFAFKDVELR